MKMNKDCSLSLLSGAALGSGLMWILDPDRGNRRRATLRDRGIRATHVLREAGDKAIRDLQHRAQGVVAELWSALHSAECSDDVLVQRVRARLGRACSHPNAISVEAHSGLVILNGPILSAEAGPLVEEVRKVRAVHGVEDRLEHHDTPGDIPDLQGGSGRRSGRRFDRLQSRWAPATRLLVGSGGLLITANGLRRGGSLGTSQALVGLGLFARAATNLELRRLVGLGGTRSAVRLQKTMNFHVPVEEVFRVCSHPENFPKFMPRVKEVRKSQDGRTFHWTVGGPAGISVHWDSEISEMVPNQLLTWRSLPGSAVRNAGIMRFDGHPDGSSRIHVLMSYNPPGGEVGHALAAIFGRDPKHVMDEDFNRLKSLLERGKIRLHGHWVTRDQISA